MKLIATEMSETSVQLTYTDGRATPEAKELLIVRMPVEGSLKRSIMWHQFNLIERAIEALTTERSRIRDAMEKND